ncbi:cytidine deaminase [Paenibacillus endophyticus]|uniref:Cytidine deaminase n=1 Tax=Paenibacillus endophyticus TaxID=1294268 RepID=A0A7W5C4L9_9BACL|nr:cytidine deaminase [Paenibacillus endophyticus]MBB3151112.1 cytidine deaminase [Paenibacillus endophyticus]
MVYEGLSDSYTALLDAAKEAMGRAYVPYSNFRVGAALLDDEGNIHHGCNIENAAYSPTNCAERTAMFRAVSDGKRPGQFQAIAVIGNTEGPIAPCGVCRQVLVEFCSPDMPVVMGNLKGDWTISTVAGILPGAFTPASLDNGER